MSFSWEVKNEICTNKAIRLRHKREQAAGLLKYATSLDAARVELDTEHKGVARLYCDLLSQYHGLSGSLTLLCRSIAGRLHYIASMDDPQDRAELADSLVSFNAGDSPEGLCAFVGGAFMACGNITDPAKSYHLEFDLPRKGLEEELTRALSSLGLAPKFTLRRGRRVVYFKESEQVEDLLTFMGAPKAALAVMNMKVEKSLRNRVNRANNCDVANLDKTLAASLRQIEAIEYILEHRGLEYIPEELRELVILRRDNPDASLNQLGQMLHPPVARSTINRRLTRLGELAAEIRSTNANHA